MKKVTLLLAFGSLLMFSNVFAQAEEAVKVKKGEVSHESQERKMKEELNLTEEQKAEMKAIKEKYSEKEQAQKEQMMALKKSMKELREAKREEMVRFGKYWYRFKNAESMADVFGRAMTFYNYLVNKVQFGAINPEEDIVVVVSHCGFLKNLRGVCEGTDVDHIQDDIINNAKIFEIDLLKKI